MRRYVVVLVVMALLIGSLFRAANQTGVRLMAMFATIGIFLFGVVGTLALSRWQSRSGLKEIESALKSLEPECLITDWAYKGSGRPDFLLVGPGGLVAVCLDETPQSTRRKRAAALIAKGRQRAEATVDWLRERLSQVDLSSQLGQLAQEVPVEPVLVLVRRRAVEEYTADGLTVLNAEQLADHVRASGGNGLLDEPARIKLTRILRTA